MLIEKHIKKLNFYEEHKYRALIRLRLGNSEILEFLEEFLETSKKNMDQEMIDQVKCIIIHAKTLFDLSKYTDAFDEVFYDKVLSKFKKFDKEPFGTASIGLANVRYRYSTLAGTLDKTHFIYNSEKESANDDRPSLEEYFEGLPDVKMRVLFNHKKDGTSIVADMVYDDKRKLYFIEACTSRGNKDQGEGADVSVVGKGLRFSPLPIIKTFGFIPDNIGIQYEMVISDKHKKELEAESKQTFANNRSAISGLLRRMIFAPQGEADRLRKLISLVPVGFEFPDLYIDHVNEWNWEEIYSIITETFIYGDVDMNYIIARGTASELLAQAKEYSDKLIADRDSLNHDIDGMVMTILNRSIQDKLGRKNHINQWQVAYKFPEQAKKTKILSLIETTGAFGYKGYLAEVDMVYLNGTKQRKGQFHSLNKFREFDPRVGDEAYLKLAGDVIPHLYRDDTCKRGDGERLKMSTKCSCGTELVEEKNKNRCPNEKCPHRAIGWLLTFVKELNAKGIGDVTCVQLHKELGITKPSQLLRLTDKDFIKLKGFAEGSAMDAYETILAILAKEHKPEAVLSSLGIDSFRQSTAEKVLQTIQLKDLIYLTYTCDSNESPDNLVSELVNVKGIDKNASVIALGLMDRFEELKELTSILKISETKKKIVKADALIVMVSGIRNDDELETVADKNGFVVKDSGKKFDMLVIKSEEYRHKGKAKIASSLSVPIYLRHEFIDKYK